MSDQVVILTDAAGNKKSVIMPYAMYEQLIFALAAHEESMNTVMKVATALVESQEVRVESGPITTRSAPSPDLLPELFDEPDSPQDQKQGIRGYQRARGQFADTGGFLVLAGSVARFHVSNAFEATEILVTLRRKLIEEGVLASDPNSADYIFTCDYHFDSASTAACIVDGNARNNPNVWRKK